nr:hypothetical protein [Tanacetum cinerariifolium]
MAAVHSRGVCSPKRGVCFWDGSSKKKGGGFCVLDSSNKKGCLVAVVSSKGWSVVLLFTTYGLGCDGVFGNRIG